VPCGALTCVTGRDVLVAVTRPSRSLALAATLSALAFAVAASCGGGEISDVPDGTGGAGSPGTGGSGQDGGPLGGSSGGAQAGSAGSSAGSTGGPGGSNNGGSAGSSSSGSAGASGGGTSGSAGASGGSGAAGNAGAGLCPPSEIGPAPSCNDPPPPGLEECATCLCDNANCRTTYEACTAQAGCARIAACVFRCAAAGATDGFEACASLGNLAEQLAASAVLQACSACEDECGVGTP
jgi:hypothetical protein